jgi:adenylate cyclase
MKFVLTEREKSYIRNALNKYLSPVYVNELVKDPKKLELDGVKSVCTAMFSDIEGFSSISESFMDDPKGLINFLKDYLSIMSDIILENKGTIDKYEVDAIIAFFGEPAKIEDHAFRACLSSLRMKQAEIELNKKILAESKSDKPILTRIGINTGEMFVGNMGTNNKFNYTMIGHSVNLASRLEGVNKVYGTYQIISENTFKFVKNDIVCRKLDRVRVVNIKTPIRLYELISLKSEANNEIIEGLDIFHRALDVFEKRKWKEAKKLFEEALDSKLTKPTINLYIKRCSDFIKQGPPASWDGFYNITIK